MNHYFIMNSESLDVLVRLSVAMVCGMLLGAERVISHKSAGMRTYALVAMGAALFAIVGDLAIGSSLSGPLVSGIVSGIGFMGAGVIIFKDASVTGLTTASGLWVAAGIGAACGFNYLILGVIATLLSLFVFIVLWYFEQGVKIIANKIDPIESEENKYR